VDLINPINNVWFAVFCKTNICHIKSDKCPKIEILSPVVRERKGEYSTLLAEMFKRGYSEAYVDGKKIDLTEKAKQGLLLARYKKHSIDVKIDELEISDKNLTRIFESVEKALKLSSGLVKIKTKRSHPSVALRHLPSGRGEEKGSEEYILDGFIKRRKS
jgi:excinuclease UvrABC ATPase subunit